MKVELYNRKLIRGATPIKSLQSSGDGSENVISDSEIDGQVHEGDTVVMNLHHSMRRAYPSNEKVKKT